MSGEPITRRKFLKLTAMTAVGIMAASCAQPTAEPTVTPIPASPTPIPASPTPEPTKPSTNILGVALPADAAPWEQQVDVSYGEFGPWEHWAEGIYGLGGGSAINYYLQEPLLATGPNRELVPVQAESWEANEDTTVWTFHIRDGLQWSDGTPITANDWVYTFQYQADPANGFDFNWFYAPIKGLGKAEKGEIKPTEIGVSAPDKLTLVFEMESSTPYWPMLVSSAFPLPKQAQDKCGKRVWSVDPACSVSSGPYILTKFERDNIAVCALNPNYKGVARPIATHYVHKYAPSGTVDPWALYQSDERASVNLDILPANVQEMVRTDSKYAEELVTMPGGLTTYICMDVTKPPFDDVRVRKAFAMSIDRETICEDVLKGTHVANYSLLPVGFPGYQGDALKVLQAYDPEKAKALMSEAGYPNGAGFPELVYYVRSDNPIAPEAVISLWQETLGVKLTVQQFDRTNFMQQMLARNFQIYQLAYGADYYDPANLLTLFLTATARHEWSSAEFDELMAESAKEPDTEKRAKLLYDAEYILLDEVGVVPLSTNVGQALWKTWQTSTAMEAVRKEGAPGGGSYTYFLMASQYYTKDTPKAWPPVDPADLA